MGLLKRKDFRNLMIGKAMSAIGSNVQQFALSLYVLSISGSASIFASMLAISVLPRLILSPIAGVFGDWFDRKQTIVRLDFLNASLIGIYGLYFYINGELSIASIYVLVVLLEIVEIFFGSAMGAVIPSMIEPEKLMEANSIRSMIMTIANTSTPLLASALYGYFGLLSILTVNALSFLLSAILELTIHIPPFHKKPERFDLNQMKLDFVDGLHVLSSHKILLNIIALGVLLNFSLSPLFSVGLIFIFVDLLKATEVQYGLIMSLCSTAMFVGPFILGRISKKTPIETLLIQSFIWVGGLTFIMACVTSSQIVNRFHTNSYLLTTMGILVFLVSMLTTVANISIGTLFDTLVPREFHGRVASVMNMGLMASIPMGQILFGYAMDKTSISFTITVVALLSLLSTNYFKKAFLTKEDPLCSTPFIQQKAES